MSRLLSLVLLLAIVAVVLTLATAPLYSRYEPAECEAAYRGARTLADTLRIDLHPAHSAMNGKRGRCGEVRAQPVSAALISAIR